MLSEQKCILNYLTEQKTAVIQGVAGTGKTLIAMEKARRHADAGERVLFLCYNAQLKTYLSENYTHENIDYYVDFNNLSSFKFNLIPVSSYASLTAVNLKSSPRS